MWLVLFANLNTGFPADPIAGRPTKSIEGSAVLVSDEYRDWQHSGSIWLLTTPDGADLPANAKVTHISLFDGTNEGVAATDRPAFSVQYHPEASPGPSDSHYLFHRFVEMIERAKA